MYTGELLNTLIFNDAESDYSKKRYQKIAFNRKVPIQHIQEAKEFIYKEADKLIFSVDNKLTELNEKPNTTQSNNTHLVGIGAYYFEENEHENI